MDLSHPFQKVQPKVHIPNTIKYFPASLNKQAIFYDSAKPKLTKTPNKNLRSRQIYL